MGLKSICLFLLLACQSNPQEVLAQDVASVQDTILEIDLDTTIVVGAERLDEYLEILKEKKIGIVANQTSRVGETHLVDTLIGLNVNVISVFSPEHGFRGDADAGAKIESSIDKKTGIPIVSLYGKNKKPTAEQIKDLDLVIFDIQDVGARFYTYISTLHYVMEACAENNVKVIVLDRPNPNGHIVDGPVREAGLKSFVGMHEVPVLHGMTIGEYAKMLNGELWLKNDVVCDLTVIECDNYNHSKFYSLPVAPSPNLQSDAAIALYPSLCLFEGTLVSVGRGTDRPFEVYGHPELEGRNYSFTPKPMYGSSSPRLNGKECFGADLHSIGEKRLTEFRIDWLISVYQDMGDENFFTTKNQWFDKLSGSSSLRIQIENNTTEEVIRASWEPRLTDFKKIREKYLLYD